MKKHVETISLHSDPQRFKKNLLTLFTILIKSLFGHHWIGQVITQATA